MRQLRNFAVLLMLVSLVSVPFVLAQPQFEVPLTVNDGIAAPTTLYFGILPTANFCIVPSDVFNGHAEMMEPPLPAGGFYTKLVWPRSGSNAACFDLGSVVDFRPFLAFAQKDTFKVFAMTDGVSMNLTWNHADVAQFLQIGFRYFDVGLGTNVDVDMLTTNSANVSGGLNPTITLTIFTSGLALPPSPPPIFSANLMTFSFGSHPVGSNTTQTLTITNAGSGAPFTDLILDPAPTVPAGFTVTPNPPGTYPINIAPGASRNFDVTFTPPTGGPFAGDIVFTHNGIAPGPISPTNIAVSGVGTTQGGNLMFKGPDRLHIEDLTTYQDTLKLTGYTGQPLKALQLVIRTHGLLSFQGVNRGSDIPLANFSFSSYVTYDPPDAFGTMPATIHVVIYGNGTNALPPGDYNDLVRFRYGVAHISPLDTQRTTISLLDVHGSDPAGVDAQVVAGPDQNVTVVPRFLHGQMYGDVNNDGFVDILDLLMVVDHILTRHLLTPDEFIRANVAPWNAGNPYPSPDAFVNVQDLAVIQSIILTGMYPDGTPVPSSPSGPPNVNRVQGLAKVGTTPDVKLTLYITNEGIAVGMDNVLRVKGLQFEFANVPAVPSNMQVTTLLGDGPYFAGDNVLRVLMYNQQARMVEPGSYLVGNMPFALANPEGVTLTRVVVAGELNNRITNVEIEITHGQAPELPVDYSLSQNYPNPFNPSTSVTFSVPVMSNVKIAVYNLLGQEISVLYDQQMDRGTKVATWNGYDKNGVAAASGPYIVRMIAGDFVASHKMMFLK